MLRNGTGGEGPLALHAGEDEDEVEHGMLAKAEAKILYVRYYMSQGGYQCWDRVFQEAVYCHCTCTLDIVNTRPINSWYPSVNFYRCESSDNNSSNFTVSGQLLHTTLSSLRARDTSFSTKTTFPVHPASVHFPHERTFNLLHNRQMLLPQ